MNNDPKKKNEKPSSNFQELIPEVDEGNKAVKKPEDKDYTKDEPHFKDPAKKREREEQPVEPIKKAPEKGV
ncbi:hypothetical protein HDF26_005329 [Pedobacter cryoconitis]|uniref:Uncharacterized protein n=1 Tax=Pedobacter cryoconitis TaxID=188932 RepID=A0A7W8ZS51_9SPHI|nr:hypothetical protein [Pedobacter cryoconitis]MBB5639184.1 hypothetical protein [Pedobacter cryoconitis]MBB6274843.1 hypothetical protein [Pedobacter cryoconitis]